MYIPPKQISHFLPTWIALASFLPVLNVPHTPSTYERHCQAILWLDAKFHSHATAYPLKKEPPFFSLSHPLRWPPTSPIPPVCRPSSTADIVNRRRQKIRLPPVGLQWIFAQVSAKSDSATIYTKLYVRISIYSDITNCQGHPCERGEELLQLSWLWGAALKHSNANAFE